MSSGSDLDPSKLMKGAGDFFNGVGNILGIGPDHGGGYGPNVTPEEAAFTEYLNQQARGLGGPSAAGLQMQQGLEQSNQNAMALAASQRGINPGLAANLAGNQQQLNQMQTNQQAGILRAQEQLGAQQTYGNQLASQRQSHNQADALNNAKRSSDQGFFANIVSSAGKAATGVSASNGGVVPGRAIFGGDHPKNDIVPAMLSPGEIVVPRTVVDMGPDAIAAFAHAVAKQGVK